MAHIDPHAVAIGQAVRGAIAQAGMNQAKYSALSGVPKNTLSRRINGSLPFTWTELVQVSEVTGVTLTELVTAAERILDRGAAA